MTSKSLNLSTIGIRKFFLCLVTLLLPIGTWAETVTYEGVFFNDTELTTSNASTIMGTGVSFDEESRVLTLNNASVTGSLVTYGTDLTISLVGDNTFNGTLYGYGIEGESAGILNLANAFGEPCSLQLISGSTTSVATGFENFTYSCFDALTDDVQYVSWTYQNLGDPHSLMYYKNGLKPVTDVTFTSGYGLQVGETVTANNARDILEDGGSVSYDPVTKTLTLTNATISYVNEVVWGNAVDLNINIIGDNYIEETITGSGLGALNVNRYDSGADCSLTVGSSEGYNPCISNFTNVTAEGLNVSASELGGMVVEGSEPLNPMFNSRKIVFTTATLYGIWVGADQVTSQNKDNILDETTGDEQPTMSFDPVNSVLTMNNASINIPYLEMSSPSFTISMDLTIQLVGESSLNCDLTVQSGYTATFTTNETTPGSLQVYGEVSGDVVYQNGMTFMPNSEYGGTVGIDNSVHYDLWIAGIQVTENTAENFFGDYSVSWNNETSTLTLSDATIGMAIDGEGEMREAPGIIYKGTDNLTINLIGTNRIYGAWGCEAILYDGESERVPQLVFSNDDSRTCSLLLSTEGDELISGFTEINYGGLYHITDVIEGEEVTISTIIITSTLMGGGSGTASDPYLIKTKEDLRDFAKYNNQGVISRQAFVKLNNEINCEDLTGFEPIGTSDYAFEGTFDGNNCTISNLEYIADEDDYAAYTGLFGKLGENGVIKKLTLNNCTFKGGDMAGAVVADLYCGTVEDCNVNYCVVESRDAQSPKVGGVAGQIYGSISTIISTVQRCKVSGSNISGATTYSEGSGMAYAGGISGYIEGGTITSCEVENSTISSSHVVTSGYHTAGGIIGYSEFDAEGAYPVTISGNAVKGTTTVSCEAKTPGSDYDKALAGAIVGYHRAITLADNTYEFTVSVSTKNASDEAACILTGYQHRGSGGYIDNDGDGYPEFVASPSDIFESNGAVLANTRKVTLPTETADVSVYPEEDTFYINDNVEDGFLAVPGQVVTLIVAPSDVVESLTLANTSTGATITAESEYIGDNMTQYSFEMPDAPVTVSLSARCSYGLTVAGVEVTDENAVNITGDLIVGTGTVSFLPETNTLFMTGDVIIGNGGVAWSRRDDLTIQFVGKENRISSLTTSAVYSTLEDAAFNLILQEGSNDVPCELTLQTPENTDIIGSGSTKVYREVSRLVDYNLTVTAQDATGAPAQWHALCVTTQFDAPVLWLDPDSETPKAVVSLGLFPGATFERQYNDVTLYTSTDGRNFNVYTEPVAVSVASPMIYARAQVRNVVSPIARGKYIGFAPQTSTVLVGTSFTPEMTQIGNGDGLSFNPDAVVYESSNPNVALFTDGVVTTVGVGTVTLTANIQQAVDVADETSYAYPLVVNDGILSFNLAVSPIDYNIWVKGIRVNSANKDNVLNDANATVRFNPVTNSLLFYGANVSINPGDTTSLVRCALSEGLTVELRGTNTLAFSAGFRNMLNTNVPLTFTTNDTKPGQLSWTLQDDVEGFFSTRFNIGYEADLELQTSGDLISVTPPVDYGLLIGSTVVTSVNCTDILGDGKVKYTDDDKTLVLNDATLTVPVTSGLSQLKIYLQGESTISGTENMLSSSVANAPLTFTTSASAPGKLTLIKTKDSGNWISGFATPSYDSPLGHTEVGNSMAVLDPASIAPIVNEENPTAEVTLTDPTDPNHPDDPVVNEVIDDVIYNLPANSFDEGSGTPEDPAGAILDEVVVKDETFYENNEPGTDGFAAGFTGLVFMLAPGTGDIQIDANIREGNKLAVQIGLSDPVLLPNEDYPTVNEMATYYVPFAVTDRTYVYVYLAETPAPSRSMSEMPNREKVLHGHVKVTQLGVAASSMVNNNVYSEQENNVGRKVKLYSLPSSAVADGGNGIVLSTVALADAAASRAVRREAAPEVYPITELAPTVFDALDKSQILYIDMKGTALEDFTVNRSSGLMGGFGSNTLIYLPDKNDDGGEPNVVINKECARLSLNSDSKFRSPMAFTAAEATLNRTFTVGRTSTVFLPFALTKAQADALGTFYKFKEIDGDNAVFYPAETNGIEANIPYIFTPKEENVSATNVSVVAVNSFSATQDNHLIGTYEQIEWAVKPDNIYGFAAAAEGNIEIGQFVQAGAGAWIQPFRAYLQVDNAASRLNFVISDEEPDDIRDISNSNNAAPDVYDLQGRKVSDTRQKTSALKAGLYIINGKKTIVK